MDNLKPLFIGAAISVVNFFLFALLTKYWDDLGFNLGVVIFITIFFWAIIGSPILIGLVISLKRIFTGSRN